MFQGSRLIYLALRGSGAQHFPSGKHAVISESLGGIWPSAVGIVLLAVCQVSGIPCLSRHCMDYQVPVQESDARLPLLPYMVSVYC